MGLRSLRKGSTPSRVFSCIEINLLLIFGHEHYSLAELHLQYTQELTTNHQQSPRAFCLFFL